MSRFNEIKIMKKSSGKRGFWIVTLAGASYSENIIRNNIGEIILNT